MNDVLPKPFTKDGMLRALEKHLPQLKKATAFPSSTQLPHPGGFVIANSSHQPLGLNLGQLSAAQSLKDETSPGKSPATASSWHSPSRMPSQSPLGTGPGPGSFMQHSLQENRPYVMNQTHPHPQTGYPGLPNPAMGTSRPPTHRRVLSDMSGGPGSDEHPDKRQRMYQVSYP